MPWRGAVHTWTGGQWVEGASDTDVSVTLCGHCNGAHWFEGITYRRATEADIRRLSQRARNDLAIAAMTQP